MSETRTMQPTERLSVTMEAQQWDQVLRLLYAVQAPMHMTRPLADEISRQCMQPRSAELHQLHPIEEGA